VVLKWCSPYYQTLSKRVFEKPEGLLEALLWKPTREGFTGDWPSLDPSIVFSPLHEAFIKHPLRGATNVPFLMYKIVSVHKKIRGYKHLFVDGDHDHHLGPPDRPDGASKVYIKMHTREADIYAHLGSGGASSCT
jgi:hypothetical protein